MIMEARTWLGDSARSCFIASTCTGENWRTLITVNVKPDSMTIKTKNIIISIEFMYVLCT